MRNTIQSQAKSRGSSAVPNPRGYASPGDFCTIFTREMDTLYPLALVLTGKHEIAERCYLAALNDCRSGSGVFPEWVRSWSKRAIIKNAIRLLQPVLKREAAGQEPWLESLADEIDASARSILRLRPFDRFVFVMSLLERYTTAECAALLGCTFRQVDQARVRALQHLGAAAEKDPMPAIYTNFSAVRNPQLLAAD